MQFNRRDFLKLAGVTSASVALAGCERMFGGGTTAVATETLIPSITPDVMIALTPTGTLVPIPTPTATLFAPETPFAASTEPARNSEINWFRGIMQGSWQSFKTRYLAGLNQVVDETNGQSITTVTKVLDWFIGRETIKAEGYDVGGYDKFFAQMTGPVKDLNDMGPDFHKRNGGQGLGFTSAAEQRVLFDFPTAQNTVASHIEITSKREGIDRSWILARAYEADRSILWQIDSWLIKQGMDPYNPNHWYAEEIQQIRRQHFERIIYGELGVIPTGVGPEWWNVTSNGNFKIACSTYINTDEGSNRSENPEQTRPLQFLPNQQNLATPDIDEQLETVLDANVPVLVTGITGTDNIPHGLVGTLVNAPDTSNVSINVQQGANVPAAFYRWLPCGAGMPGQPGLPEVTPGPPGQPTPMPTNIDIFPTKKPRGEGPPGNPSGDPHQGPTEIP